MTFFVGCAVTMAGRVMTLDTKKAAPKFLIQVEIGFMTILQSRRLGYRRTFAVVKPAF